MKFKTLVATAALASLLLVGCGGKTSSSSSGSSTSEKQLEHVAAVAATHDNSGNIEYWYDEETGKYYSDAEGKNEITQDETVAPALHTWDEIKVDSGTNNEVMRYCLECRDAYYINSEYDFDDETFFKTLGTTYHVEMVKPTYYMEGTITFTPVTFNEVHNMYFVADGAVKKEFMLPSFKQSVVNETTLDGSPYYFAMDSNRVKPGYNISGEYNVAKLAKVIKLVETTLSLKDSLIVARIITRLTIGIENIQISENSTTKLGSVDSIAGVVEGQGTAVKMTLEADIVRGDKVAWVKTNSFLNQTLISKIANEDDATILMESATSGTTVQILLQSMSMSDVAVGDVLYICK